MSVWEIVSASRVRSYKSLPKFRPIIDLTGAPYYAGGKYLSSLLNTFNEYSLDDCFEAYSCIQETQKDLFQQGYKFCLI